MFPPGWPAGIAAGLHLVAYLPDDLDEAAVVAAAAQRGVAVHGLDPYRISGQGRPGLIFGYADLHERQIAEGVTVMAGAIADESGAVRRSSDLMLPNGGDRDGQGDRSDHDIRRRLRSRS